jgi:protein-L-isoaspartate(D-aspartate) O-methyltransferase
VYADSLRQSGAIKSDAVHAAFATVPRHRFLPHFRYRADEYTIDVDHEPPADVLDLVYANNALITHTGSDGDPTSSSSAPSIMAKMLETLDLRPGLRTLEIGAGTGYNAALIHHITGAPVVTVEAGRQAATEATTALRELGLSDDEVSVIHADGYPGYPQRGPFDRIIVTCGIAGIPVSWLDQLAPGGRILAPIAHAGVHPIVALDQEAPAGPLTGQVRTWGDFMPAAGSLRPASLFHHDPADDIPATDAQRISDAGPLLDQASYHDLWCYLGAVDTRATRAYPNVGAFDLSQGVCALVDPNGGTAWVHQDGTMTVAGNHELGEQLPAHVRSWERLGRPAVDDWVIDFLPLEHPPGDLLLPRHWRTDTYQVDPRSAGPNVQEKNVP